MYSINDDLERLQAMPLRALVNELEGYPRVKVYALAVKLGIPTRHDSVVRKSKDVLASNVFFCLRDMRTT